MWNSELFFYITEDLIYSVSNLIIFYPVSLNVQKGTYKLNALL